MPGHEHDAHDHDAHEELREQPADARGAGRPEETGSQALAGALKSSFRFLKWAMVLLVLAYLATGVFKVDVNEVKFKLRFGRPVPPGSTAPLRSESGLHLRWPWEEVVPIRTDEQTLVLDKEFWAGAETGPDIRMAPLLRVRTDGYLLTGDANIVHMKLRVRYRVSRSGEGAAAYAFLIQDPEETLRREVKASVVKVVGSMPVMAVINRTGLLEQISQELDRRKAAFEERSGVPLGIEVVAVEAIEQENIKNPTEPAAARQAFFDAQNAVSRRNAMVSEGKAQAETIINSAEAQRAEILAIARGDALRMVRSAKADAAEMQQLLPVYEHSGAEANLLLEDFYQRAVVDVLAQAPGAFLLHEQPQGASRQLRLMFTRTPVENTKQPEKNQPPAGQPGR